jgi:hypothetical protein
MLFNTWINFKDIAWLIRMLSFQYVALIEKKVVDAVEASYCLLLS